MVSADATEKAYLESVDEITSLAHVTALTANLKASPIASVKTQAEALASQYMGMLARQPERVFRQQTQEALTATLDVSILGAHMAARSIAALMATESVLAHARSATARWTAATVKARLTAAALIKTQLLSVTAGLDKMLNFLETVTSAEAVQPPPPLGDFGEAIAWPPTQAAKTALGEISTRLKSSLATYSFVRTTTSVDDLNIPDIMALTIEKITYVEDYIRKRVAKTTDTSACIHYTAEVTAHASKLQNQLASSLQLGVVTINALAQVLTPYCQLMKTVEHFNTIVLQRTIDEVALGPWQETEMPSLTLTGPYPLNMELISKIGGGSYVPYALMKDFDAIKHTALTVAPFEVMMEGSKSFGFPAAIGALALAPEIVRQLTAERSAAVDLSPALPTEALVQHPPQATAGATPMEEEVQTEKAEVLGDDNVKDKDKVKVQVKEEDTEKIDPTLEPDVKPDVTMSGEAVPAGPLPQDKVTALAKENEVPNPSTPAAAASAVSEEVDTVQTFTLVNAASSTGLTSTPLGQVNAKTEPEEEQKQEEPEPKAEDSPDAKQEKTGGLRSAHDESDMD